MTDFGETNSSETIRNESTEENSINESIEKRSLSSSFLKKNVTAKFIFISLLLTFCCFFFTFILSCSVRIIFQNTSQPISKFSSPNIMNKQKIYNLGVGDDSVFDCSSLIDEIDIKNTVSVSIKEKSHENFPISHFGSVEFECSGSCYCDENNDYSQQKTTSIAARKGMIYFVSALSSVLAIKYSKTFFEEECKIRISDECSFDLIRSEVDQCSRKKEQTNEEQPFQKSNILEEGIISKILIEHIQQSCSEETTTQSEFLKSLESRQDEFIEKIRSLIALESTWWEITGIPALIDTYKSIISQIRSLFEKKEKDAFKVVTSGNCKVLRPHGSIEDFQNTLKIPSYVEVYCEDNQTKKMKECSVVDKLFYSKFERYARKILRKDCKEIHRGVLDEVSVETYLAQGFATRGSKSCKVPIAIFDSP